MITPPEPRSRASRGFLDLNAHTVDTILTGPADHYEEGGFVRRVVGIRGRRTGAIHSVPLAVVTLFGGNYLVSPQSERNWVRNLTSSPHCVVRGPDMSETRYAVRVIDRARAAEIISTYLGLMNSPWTIEQFPFGTGATLSQIQSKVDQAAVFELTQPAHRPATGNTLPN
jgi:hypothetical protein